MNDKRRHAFSHGARLGIVSALIVGGLLSCVRQKVDLGEAHRLPNPDQILVSAPGPVAGSADTITDIAMKNVAFHVDDDARLGIRRLRGRMRALNGSHVVSFDDRAGQAVDIASAEVALTPKSLSIILNRYVFGYKGSPLKDLVVRTEGDHIVQTGTMHKLIDIPFEMTAELSITDDGWIKVHPTRIEICNLDGQKLLKAVGASLQSMMDLSGAKGAKVVGNDLFLNPMLALPPPKMFGKATGIRVEGNEVVQTFGPASAATAALTIPAQATNYLYFHGGTIKFGKLYMVNADLLTVDADPTDPFDFYMDYYHTMLVAGYHVTLPNYGLVTYMPDFDDIGMEKGKVGPGPGLGIGVGVGR
jgi:hypothetical protein